MRAAITRRIFLIGGGILTAIGKRLAQARESTLANTVAAAPRVDLIHPGAQRYLREIGLLK